MRPVQTGRVKAGRLSNRGAFVRLFGAELRRMLRSPWFIGAVAAAMVLVAASAVLDYLSYSEWYGYARAALDRGGSIKAMVCKAAWRPCIGWERTASPSPRCFTFFFPCCVCFRVPERWQRTVGPDSSPMRFPGLPTVHIIALKPWPALCRAR